MGYSYQLLYSCYKILNFLDSDKKIIKLEGIEDIDTYRTTVNDGEVVEFTQLKYSGNEKHSDFFYDILESFLEVYLSTEQESNQYFKLVYNMKISTRSHLNKLINSKLEPKSEEYWKGKIKKIQSENAKWNWSKFNFNVFLKLLKFERLPKEDIVNNIHKSIIKKFNIDTGNEYLYLNSLFYQVFHKAQNGEEIRFNELLNIIQSTKDGISKGYQNPSIDWIEKIDFNKSFSTEADSEFFEGKKATPQHIASKIPVRRGILEKNIEKSINDNTITVIKSSSGQGKTTLALQVAYNLKEEYEVYRLNWCRESKELGNIIKYFNSRLKLGEKILILLDNLDKDLVEWNKLSQILYERITLNYKILLTTREEDWYLYSGDQSNLYNLRIIDIFMDIDQAQNIYTKFKEKGKIHKDIKGWQAAWEKIADRKLLIEYVFLLTHGEMIEERIKSQIKRLNQSIDGYIKLEAIRLIAFSDVIGIKVRGDKLVQYLNASIKSLQDINEILNSIENEYFIKVKNENIYIEGLHPVRSQHILNELNSYKPISDAIIGLLEIIDDFYIEQVFSQIPLYVNSDKEEFYRKIVIVIKNKSYEYLVKAIKGIFSGFILKYFIRNKEIFDDANLNGGLLLFINEINPWNSTEKIGTEIKTLEEILKIQPDNKLINYLINLKKEIAEVEIEKSDIYIFCNHITQELQKIPLAKNLENFGILANWLSRIDSKFNILKKVSIGEVWDKKDQFNFEELTLLMYEFYKFENDLYMQFINSNRSQIFSFLKIKTDTASLNEGNGFIFIKYILLPNEIGNSNEQSVERINKICRFLPIYSKYCTEAIIPHYELLDNIRQNMPDDSHKAMPRENVMLSFNTDLISLWQKSIFSQYEFPSIYDWQEYWFDMRWQILDFIKLNIKLLENRLNHNNISDEFIKTLDEKRSVILNSLLKENLFPYEDRPFRELSKLGIYSKKIKQGYFKEIKKYINNFFNILKDKNDNNMCNIAIINLKDARNNLLMMHDYYNFISKNSVEYFRTDKIEKEELINIDKLVNLNDFYLEYSEKNVSYSNKILIDWVKRKNKEYIEVVSRNITKIRDSCDFGIIPPKKILEEGNLKIIVVGIDNFDIYDEEQHLKLLYNFIPFIDIEFNFLVFIFISEDKSINQRGIRISKDSLINFRNATINQNEDEADSGINPIPIEITKEYLDVLGQEKLSLPKEQQEDNSEKIVLFLLYLWKFSKYKENLNLSNALEKDYLFYLRDIIEKELDELEREDQERIITKFSNKLFELKRDVLDGDSLFMDNDLNYWINRLFMHIKNNLLRA